MKSLYIVLFCAGTWIHSVAQPTAHPGTSGGGTAVRSQTWQLLTDVKFELRNGYSYPRFGEKVKALQGKTIELEGYLFPFENTRWSTHFALSSLPLNACFFCGSGGPETVVEVEASQPVRQSDKPIRIRGILELNATDVERMIYVLRQAVIVNP